MICSPSRRVFTTNPIAEAPGYAGAFCFCGRIATLSKLKVFARPAVFVVPDEGPIITRAIARAIGIKDNDELDVENALAL